MFLNAKNNNFRFEFPRDFFFKEVVDKYTPYIKKMPVPYDNLRDYINASVQSITFPSVAGPTVDQTLLEDPIVLKGRGDTKRWMSRDFSVTFKLCEGYLNYWIMFEQLMAFYDYHNGDYTMGDVILQFLDNNGFEFIAFRFGKIVYTGISELNLSFSSNIPEFQTFTCDFKYNYPTILNRKD